MSTRDLAGQPDAHDLVEQATATGEPTGGSPDLDLDSSADDGPDRAEHAPVDEREPLLPGDQSDRFTSQWQEIQASFVDRPRESVQQADTLVADLMQRLAASFSDERERLEAQWDSGDDVSTEDLRVALTRYRSFFDRLLAA